MLFFASEFEQMPTEIPATGFFIGPPASTSASVPPQTEAIDVDPFDSIISQVKRIAYGNSLSGTIGAMERSASAPWPISRRPGPLMRPVSPTEKFGKL